MPQLKKRKVPPAKATAAATAAAATELKPAKKKKESANNDITAVLAEAAAVAAQEEVEEAAAAAAAAAEQQDPTPSLDAAIVTAKDSSKTTRTPKKRTAATPPEPPLSPEEAVVEWNAMLFELLHFKAKNGDFNVRATDEENKKLHTWMQTQRKQYKLFQNNMDECSITDDQVQVLDSLHFSWNTRGEEHWKRNYERLRDYHKENGHTLVPRQSPVPKLGDWVTEQRRQYKAMREGKDSLLTKDRVNLLELIGFVWQVRQRTGWQDRFEQLIEFKAKNNGSTIVPQHYAENRALGKWVAKQREQYRLLSMGKHSFLTPDRVQQLKSIDFVWSVKGRTPEGATAVATAMIPKEESTNVDSEQPIKSEADEDNDVVDEATEAAVAEAVAAVATEEKEQDGGEVIETTAI